MEYRKIIKAAKPSSMEQKLAFNNSSWDEPALLTKHQFGEAFARTAHDMGLRDMTDLVALRSGKLTSNVQEGLVQFASDGSVSVGNFSAFWQMLIRQIGSTEDPSWALTPYFPDAIYESQKVIVEVLDKMSGTLPERPLGTNLPDVKRLGFSDYEFSPFSYGAQKIFTEADIFSRRLGSSDVALNDLMQRIGWDMYDLQVRMFITKKLLLSQAIFDGQISYNGRTVSYGIPTENTLYPPNEQAWGTYDEATKVWKINFAAKPLLDLQILLNQSPVLRKYLHLPMKIFLTNVTHNLFFSNPNNQNTMQFAMGNPDFLNRDNPYNMQSAISYFMGSQNNIEVVVVDDSYFTNDDSPSGPNAVEGEANFIIPTGKILFAIDTNAFGGPLGEFAYTLAAQNGSMLNPKGGPWMVIDDQSLPGTAGSVTNPFVRAAAGFSGAPKINRPFDIITMDVTVGTAPA